MTSATRPHDHPWHWAIAWQQLLLSAGVAAAAVYLAADVVCGLSYPDYSFANQVISELSAVGSPTAARWSAFMPAFGVLFAAFAVGVLLASRENRRLRITSRLLVAFVLTGPLWTAVPMHQRGEVFTWTDAGHITLGAISVLLMAATVYSAAWALGPRFRSFSLGILAVVLPAGAASFLFVGRIMHQQPTPFVGVLERVSIHGFFLWVAVLAVALVRGRAL